MSYQEHSARSSLDTIKTILSREDYSNEFESEATSDITSFRDSTNTQHDGDSWQYSDDFDSSIPSRPTSSVRFSEDLEFISTTPTLHRQFSSYSEDFESGTDEPYTEDFETDTQLSRIKSPYSTDTVESKTQCNKSSEYTESFESYTTENGYSSDQSSEQTIDSVVFSPRKKHDSYDYEASGYTSEPSYTCTRDEGSDTSYTIAQSTTDTADTEVSVSFLAKDAFLKKKLLLLRERPSVEAHHKKSRLSRKQIVKGKKSDVNEFCKEKLLLVQNKKDASLSGETVLNQRLSETYKERVTGLRDSSSLKDFGITDRQVSYLKLRNTLARVQNMANMKVHEPRKCKKCLKKYEMLEEEEFLKHKYAIVTEKSMTEKLEEENIKLNDPLHLMSQILKDLPRLSDDRGVIYEKLMQPLKTAIKDGRCVYVDIKSLEENINNEQFWCDYFSRLQHCPWVPQQKVDT